jgi:putative inorganic carbon (HCO3(-)) transporter
VTAVMNLPPAHSAPRWRRAMQRLAWLEPFWVILIGLALLMPPRFLPENLQSVLTSYRPALTFLLVLFWPIRWLAYGQLTRRTPLDWPLVFMLAWLPVNYWASVDKALSWTAISYLLFGVALYLALINWPPARQRPALIGWLILIVGIGLTLAAPLLSELTGSKLFRVPLIGNVLERLKTLLPGTVNANILAGALTLIIPMPVALAIRHDWARRRWLPISCALLSVMMLAALILTQSRGAYLATAVATGVILALRWPKLWYAVPVLLIAGGIAVIQIGPINLFGDAGSSSAINGLDGRLELWSRALYAISDFPFTGIGVGTFERVIPVLYPLFSIGPDTVIPHAHNLLLQVSVDLGLPGLIAYTALFINIFVMLINRLRQREAALEWALAAGTLGGLIAMFIHGLFDVPVWGTRPAVLPWLLIALAMQVGLRPSTRPPI